MTSKDARESRLSPTDLAAHLACPHLTQLERQRREGTLTITFLPDPRLEALQERGRQHEEAYLAKLRAAGRTIRDLRETRDPSATIAAMREGCDAIVQAPLASGAFYGIADVLVRCETPSKNLGAYSYEPVDTKLARETRATTVLQLSTYCELLTAAQGVEPEHFYVVTPLKEETYRASDFSAYYRFVRSGFASAAITEPAPDTYPDPVEYCDICRYWKHCGDRRRADYHPSLIAGIHAAHVREFQAQARCPRSRRSLGAMGRYPTSPAVDAARPTPASASRRGSSWPHAACPAAAQVPAHRGEAEIRAAAGALARRHLPRPSRATRSPARTASST